MTLWSRRPAQQWQEALPLGNGRLGAMVFGSAPDERLVLNEESLWAGEPFDVYPERFGENLRTTQRLVLDSRFIEARAFGLEHLTAEPTAFRSYEPLADLWVQLDHSQTIYAYRRELDLRNGIVRVRYRAGSVAYQREILISAVDDVIAMRISAHRPGMLSGILRLSREKDIALSTPAPDRLHLDGQIIDIPAPEGYDDNPGGSGPGGAHMKFAARLLARVRAGSIRAEQNALLIQNADEILILLTAATDFNIRTLNMDRSIDPGKVADRILQKSADKPWDDILQDHVKEHRALFDRVSIDLGRTPQDQLPTDERLAALKAGAVDPGLSALYFQYGRYLLMSSSRRPGRLPANLQGLWSDRMWAAWEADYHLNINLQMNYWPADLCNLSETIDPLTDWFAAVTEKGKTSAKQLYDADGWVAFTMVNLFGRTTPAGSTRASQFQNGVLDPLAGAWMAMTLWRHDTFTHDETWLRDRAYPILKGAAEFLLDHLVEDTDGSLTVVPSTSPENSYLDPATGRTVRITHGSTYHLTIVREIFTATIHASELLGIDEPFRHQLERAFERIPPLAIGKDGTIQEWCEDFEEAEPGHRHMSHLLGLHPFAQITPQSPDLYEAARKTVERRLAHGGGQCGWSRAWIVNLYTRLQDGDEAHRHLHALLSRSTHANFFEDNPLFQIDAFLAGTAGIAEMLLQSHDGQIHLLPALPKAWPQGHVHGLKARGGFIVDLDWNEGKLTAARIHSQKGNLCRIRYPHPLHVSTAAHPIAPHNVNDSVIEFPTHHGETCTLTADGITDQ